MIICTLCTMLLAASAEARCRTLQILADRLVLGWNSAGAQFHALSDERVEEIRKLLGIEPTDLRAPPWDSDQEFRRVRLQRLHRVQAIAPRLLDAMVNMRQQGLDSQALSLWYFDAAAVLSKMSDYQWNAYRVHPSPAGWALFSGYSGNYGLAISPDGKVYQGRGVYLGDPNRVPIENMVEWVPKSK